MSTCITELIRFQSKSNIYCTKILSLYNIIIINNSTYKVQRPVGWNTMKIGLSSATYCGLYGI